jgi:Raf kinase inhibitor-like YbhB/YbcL family protein
MAHNLAAPSRETVAIQRVHPHEQGRLSLASDAIGPDARIGHLYSGYHDNLSPPLEWTGIPEAETFALIVEDPDAPAERPALHWMIWNIPGVLTALPRGVRHGERLAELGGAVQGRNSLGQHGYMGPRPPPEDGAHRYHIQLFALDLTLDLPPGAPLEALVSVLKGRAIAAGELVELYAAGQDLPAPSARTFAPVQDRAGLDEDDLDHHAPHDAEGVVRPGA